MVDWSAVRAFTERSCADIFDVTPCRLIGMAPGLSGNHPDTLDDTRPAFDFLGTVDLQPPSDLLRRSKPSDTGIRGDVVTYDAVLSALVTEWAWMPRRKDLLLAGGRTWMIWASERDGSGRPAWYLTEVRHAVG